MHEMPILLTTKDVSRVTGRAIQTLINDRHTGKGLPYIKIGASVRYLKEDIENHIKRNRIVPRQEAEA